MTIQSALDWANTLLSDHNIDISNGADTRLLLCDVLACPSSTLYAYPSRLLDAATERRYRALVKRRCSGEPIAYVLGETEFYSYSITTDSRALIPRPETEQFVTWILDAIKINSQAQVADLGCGSGAISIALAKLRPQIHIDACDNNPQALALAKHNIKRHQLEQHINLLKGDWCQSLGQPRRYYDVIVSNPPYIASNYSELTKAPLCYEPQNALVAGANGYAALHTIIATAQSYLRDNGLIFLEHGHDQAEKVRGYFEEYNWKHIHSQYDFENRSLFSCATALP